MGNIPSGDLAKSDPEFEKELLNLQSSVLFNDVFITSLMEKIPSYGSSELDDNLGQDDAKSDATDEEKGNEHEQRLENFLTIFSPKLNNIGKIEDFPVLSADKSIARSGFSVMSQRRSRLLIRLFQVYAKQLEQIRDRSTAGTDNSLFWQLPSDVGKGKSSSEQDVSSNLSIGMSLSLARAFGSQNSAVVKTILQSLLDSFLAFKPVSLEMTPGLEHTLNLIRTFVTDMMTTNSDEEIKSLALSLQLAMGLIVGSVMTIVQTVEVLACNKWMINDKVMAMVAACSEIPVDFDISFPNGKKPHDKFSFSFEVEEDKKSLLTIPQLISIASDGTYYYIYEGLSATITKIGSGLNGTLCGEIICTSSPLKSSVPFLSSCEETTPNIESNESSGPAFQLFSQERRSSSIELSSDRMSANCQQNNGSSCSVFVDYSFPSSLTNENLLGHSYFEITVVGLSGDDEDEHVLAVGFATAQLPLDSDSEFWNEHAFYWTNSSDYMGNHQVDDDDNDSNSNSQSGSESEMSSDSVMFSSWENRDVIGCGIDYEKRKIFFTRNGHVRSSAFDLSSLDQLLYPVVTMTNGRQVYLNTGQSPFRYQGALVSGPMFHVDNLNRQKPVTSSSQLLASMTVKDNNLIVHFSGVSNSRQLAVFDSRTLQYTGILDLSAAVDSPISLTDDNEKIQEDLYDFQLDISEGSQSLVCIRATEGYAMEVLLATVGDHTVTDSLKLLVNEHKSSLFCRDLRKELLVGQLTLPKDCFLKLQLKCIKTSVVQIHLPIASTPTALYLIEETDGSSVDSIRIYDVTKEVRIRSAVMDLNGTELDLLQEALRNWSNFLETIHSPDVSNNIDQRHNDDLRSLREVNLADGNGDAATQQLNVTFSLGKGATQAVTFIEKTNWNNLLVELEQVLDKREPAFNVLKLNVWTLHKKSPLQAKLMKKYALTTPGYEPLCGDRLSTGSLLCNDHQLMVLIPSVANKSSIYMKGWKFSLDGGGEIQRFLFKTFADSCGTPLSFSFDIANNSLVAFDAGSMNVVRWRNAGYSPAGINSSNRKIDHHQLTDNDNIENILNRSPSLRLQLLLSKSKSTPSSELQATILLSLLDKLSEPFGTNVLSDNLELDALNQVKLTAVGSSDDDKNRCHITIRDQAVDFDDDINNGAHNGYHIVVLNRHSYLIEKTRWFDTKTSIAESNRMGDFLNDLSDGTLILVASAGSIKKNVGRYATDALMNFGCSDIESFAKGTMSLIMIGIKGLKPGSADVKTGLSNDSVELVRFLPPAAIPLKLDPSVSSITSLLNLCRSFYGNFKSCDELCKTCFLAALRLLQVNLHNFTSRNKVSDATKQMTVDKIADLKTFLELLLSSSWMDIDSFRNIGVGLFVASLTLVYPSTADLIRLLETITSKYISKAISHAEVAQLEVLLKRLLRSDDLFSMVGGKLDFESPAKLLAVVQLIAEEELRVVVSKIGDLHYHMDSPILEAAVNLLQYVAKQTLAFASSSIGVNSASSTLSFSDANQVFRTVSIIAKLSSNVLEQVQTSITDKSKVSEVDTTAVLTILQRSPVGTVLPVAILTVTELVRKYGYQMISLCMESILLAIEDVNQCLSLMNSVLSLLSVDARSYNDCAPSRVTTTHHFESEHPYRSNMDEETILSFPGAVSVSISFDPNSKTEDNCDYVQFLDTNKCSLHPQIEKFTGRNGNENWPGCGGRAPLELQSNNFILLFHSDGSVEDWGYKFTVTANYPAKIVRNNRDNWLLKLSFDLVQSLTAVGMGLIQGPEWKEELESKCSSWMENSLVKAEYFDQSNFGSATEIGDEQTQFLWGLVYRNTIPTADSFLRKIRQFVPEDQGTDDIVNDAVYATSAVLIRVNNVITEAIAFANGVRSTPSHQLVQAWKSGQKVRNYLAGGDLRRGGSGGSSTKGLLTMFSGTAEEVTVSASAVIVARAKFLLRSNQCHNDARETADAADVGNIGNTVDLSPTKSTTKELPSSPYALNVESVSPDKTLSASKKWQLASKAVKFQRFVSNETKNVAVMWHSLVDEAVVLDKLKNVFLQRRLFLEKSKTEKEVTPSEKVLEFIESDVDLKKLHETNALRNKRAIVRSKGFDIFAHLLTSTTSPFSIFIATSQYVLALRKLGQSTKSDSDQLHYAHSVEGCSPEQNNLLWQKFSAFLNGCATTMRQLVASIEQSETDIELREKSLISTIRACALDFDPTDHQLVHESGIASILENILCSHSVSKFCKKTASALLDTIVGRFMVFGSLDEGPTELSKSLINILANLLSKASHPQIGKPPVVAAHELLGGHGANAIVHSSEVIAINALSNGRSIGHFDLPFAHSICFTVGRRKTFFDDGESVKVATGLLVTRSRFWEIMDKNRVDGGVGSIGIIRTVLDGGKKVLVKWSSGKEHVHTIGTPNAEVVFADSAVAGFLFSKGLSGSSVDSSLNAISAQLLPDASILVVYRFANDTITYLRTNCCIPMERWVSIAIVADYNSKLRVYMDGDCVGITSICESNMPGTNSTVELTSTLSSIADTNSKAKNMIVSIESELDSAVLRVSVPGSGDVDLKIATSNDWPGKLNCPSLLLPSTARLSIPTYSETQSSTIAHGRNVSDHDLKKLSRTATQLPLFIGHPPEFFSSPVCGTPSGATLLLKRFIIFDCALSLSALKEIGNNDSGDPDWQEVVTSQIDELAILNTLGTLKRSLSSKSCLLDTSIRRCITNNGIIDKLFELFKSNLVSIQLAAYDLAAAIFPSMDIELVDGCAFRQGLVASVDSESFIQWLCKLIGEGENTWLRRTTNSLNSNTLEDDCKTLILHAQIHLIRSLALGRPEWKDTVCHLLDSLVNLFKNTWPQLKLAARQSLTQSSASQEGVQQGSLLYVLMSLIGGSPISKIGPGSIVMYTDDVSALSEKATVPVRPTWG